MDNFTKRHFKKPKELLKDIKNEDFALTKRELDSNKSKKTFKKLSKDGKKIKNKIDQLKQVQSQLFNKENPDKEKFIERKKPNNLK